MPATSQHVACTSQHVTSTSQAISAAPQTNPDVRSEGSNDDTNTEYMPHSEDSGEDS